MKPSYRSRREKSLNPNYIPGDQKKVRIDANTEIMVSVTIADDVARQKFIEKRDRGPRAPYSSRTPDYEKIREAFREIPVGSVEEMANIIDDSTLPERE